MKRYVVLVGCLALLVTSGIGCSRSGGKTLAAAVKKVQSGETDTIDCRELEALSDEQMQQLAQANGLERLKALILDDSKVTDAGVQSLPWLPALTTFSASKTQITDGGVGHLSKVGNLETLRLDQARITDLGLQSVGKMKSLRSVSLWKCAVTDQGLQHLRGLPHLETLSLDETGVTAAGLRTLVADLPGLRKLKVWKTKVTAAEADDLVQKFPAVKVSR